MRVRWLRSQYLWVWLVRCSGAPVTWAGRKVRASARSDEDTSAMLRALRRAGSTNGAAWSVSGPLPARPERALGARLLRYAPMAAATCTQVRSSTPSSRRR